MKNRILQMKRMKQTFLLLMLLSVVGMTNCFADDYDFSDVCSTGQTLYYKITDNTAQEVQLTYPKYYSYTTSGYIGGDYWGTYTVTSYWYNYTKPTGDIIVPDCIVYNEISYSVTSIRENTFYDGCTGITSIVIPSTVSSIGNDAFRSCSGLTAMTVLAETPPVLGSNVFYNVNKNIPVIVPCGSVESYQNTSIWNEFTNWQCITETDNHTINATPNPAEGGIITGSGTYEEGQACTLTATANEGYTFVNWTEDGEEVSTEATYSFTVTGNRNLAANFTLQGSAPTGAINGLFSVGENTQVYFSQGNLQYKASTNTWRFAENQWDYVGTQTPDAQGNVGGTESGSDNANISSSYNGWIDLFGWGTGDNPTNSSTENSEYNNFTEWGVNPISNGGNIANKWRTLTKEEWRYLMFDRITSSGKRYAEAVVNGVAGVILLSDNWSSSNYTFTHADTITMSDWMTKFESHGAVFLPSAGCRRGIVVEDVGSDGTYWSSTPHASNNMAYIQGIITYSGAHDRSHGLSVRLVRSVSAFISCNIEIVPNPADGGIVTGTGVYEEGQACTLTATANEGYTFVNWTEDGEEVSTEATYSFTVTGNRNLVANFTLQGSAPTGAINGLFSVGENTQVYFSQGNLQYKASTNTWRFAENQWDYVGEDNSNVSETNEGWIDLFGWGTSGWNSGANCYQPWNTGTTNSDYYPGGTSSNDLTGDYAYADWGVNNAISNGGNVAGQWHTLTREEWEYVFNTRSTPSGIRYAKAQVNGTNGLILLPDNWNDSIFSLNNANNMGAGFSSNVIDASDWMGLESGGAVFLPAAGNRNGTSVYDAGEFGFYWSTSSYNANYAYSMYFYNSYLNPLNLGNRCFGLSVRLVRSFYDISVISSPAEGGTTTGGGTLLEGSTCTLTATANEGYAFINWTKDGVEVSNSETYSFMVTGNDTIVANFEKGVAVIGSGTATNVYLPSYSYYKQSLSQQIYTAEEIGDEGIINSVAFYNAGTSKTRSYDIYMVSTEKAEFESSSDWIAVTESDLVYSGEFDMNADTWTVFQFDTPFHYDGVSNIALVVDDNTGDWTDSPHMACRVFDADGNQAIRVYSDNTNYDPYNPTGYVGTLLTVKNQIKLGIIPTFHFITEGVWSEASNWQGGVLPGDTDVVFIDASCQLDQNATVDALTVTEGQSLTLQSGQTLTVTNTLKNSVTTGLIIEDSAQLVHASENVYATVKKNIVGHGTSRKNHYYLISNPLVSIVNPEQANIYHLTRGNYDLYNWLAGSADSLEWRNFKDFSFMMHPEGYGYLYANQGGVELVFPGVIRRSDIGFGKSVSCIADEVFHFNGWNLIGNPFVCDAYLVDKNNEPLPFYRMNAAGKDFEADTLGVIAPMESVFYIASENDTIYFVRTDYSLQLTCTISVSAAPIDGGIVSGGGTYSEGQSCTVTAIANDGYNFCNWTENDSVVSTQANYQFIVTESRTLVANFTYVPPTYTISVSANSTNGGTVSGGGVYTEGQTCTVSATANSNYIFTSWTENGEVVSTDATYIFSVTGERTLVANFEQIYPVGAINGKFTINADGDQVYFSQGNLQYQAFTNTWRFANNQWDYVGEGNANISPTYDGWIDLFGWGTSGYHNSSDQYNRNYRPWSTSSSLVDNNFNGTGYGPSTNMASSNLTGSSANYDWGVYNVISNGGNIANQWRTLTQPEWAYVFNTRSTTSGIRYAKAQVNNVNGVILLSDDWSASTYSLNNTNTTEASFSSNVISAMQWTMLEDDGAVFLPAAGIRSGTSVDKVGSYGYYWSASYNDDPTYINYSYLALIVYFYDTYLGSNNNNSRSCGSSVRLVCPVEN